SLGAREVFRSVAGTSDSAGASWSAVSSGVVAGADEGCLFLSRSSALDASVPFVASGAALSDSSCGAGLSESSVSAVGDWGCLCRDKAFVDSDDSSVKCTPLTASCSHSNESAYFTARAGIQRTDTLEVSLGRYGALIYGAKLSICWEVNKRDWWVSGSMKARVSANNCKGRA